MQIIHGMDNMQGGSPPRKYWRLERSGAAGRRCPDRPRKVGKATLAHAVAAGQFPESYPGSIRTDLEREGTPGSGSFEINAHAETQRCRDVDQRVE
jgi:hypothetical protein